MPQWNYRLVIDPNQRVKILLYPLSWIKIGFWQLNNISLIVRAQVSPQMTSSTFTLEWILYIFSIHSRFCFIQSCDDSRCFSESRQTPQMAEFEGFYVTKCCWQTDPMSRIDLNSTKDTGNPLYREFSRMPVPLKCPQSCAREKKLCGSFKNGKSYQWQRLGKDNIQLNI